MKQLFITLLCVAMSNSLSSFEQETEKEFKPRKGLPNFFNKAMRGAAIKAAYLGGSITAQEGWRVLSLNWFKARFPKATFTQVNAAIGGTGSDFGVFRLQDHVLRHQPDLLFVEFAVNDRKTDPAKIVRAVEGIVRQTIRANPRTDICFVYTIISDFLPDEQKGILPYSAVEMEKVADRYGIPTINFGFEVAKQISNKQLIIAGDSTKINSTRVFSPDNVHPYIETGHVIYNDVLKRSFEKMIPAVKPATATHKLTNKLAKDCHDEAQTIDVSKAKLSANWALLDCKTDTTFNKFREHFQFVGKAEQSGETITIHFRGRAAGAFDVMGPDAGRIVAIIDGVEKQPIYRFDAYCTYRRMSYILVDGLENKEHTVIFKTVCEPFDKAAILAQRGNKIANPDAYKPNNWYVGKIFIDGKLL